MENGFESRVKERIFWAKYGTYRSRDIRAYHELIVRQNWPRERLEVFNWNRRLALLSHAYANVPFYRNKWSSLGFHPKDVRLPEDYATVPVLTKEELRAHCDELRAENCPWSRLSKSTTGGSTGMPVTLWRDRQFPLAAYSWRAMQWWGIDPSMDGAFIWRLSHSKCQGIRGLLYSVAWWPTRKLRLDASCMTDTSIREFLVRYNSIAPPLLQGYAGAIHHVASFVKSNGIAVVAPKAIWVTSSPVSEVQRSVIESAFHAPVYDQYGSCEVSNLATQCAQRGALHIDYDGRHIEFAGEDDRPVPTGDVGRILVTDLEDFCSPLIRYDIGDRGSAVAGTCPCGITLPLMSQVKGRVTDMIRLPDGTVLAGDYMTTVFDGFPDAVAGFQFRQLADLSIKLLYVSGESEPHAARAVRLALDTIRDRTKGNVIVSAEAVREIPHDRGKTRYVISEVVEERE